MQRRLDYWKKKDDPSSLIEDLCTSLSIVIREGDSFNFIHRSFQEYFAARFMSKVSFPAWSATVEAILKERSGDTVIEMMFELNRSRLERDFIKDRVDALCKDLDQIDPQSELPQLLSLFYISFAVNREGPFVFLAGNGRDPLPVWTHLTDILSLYEEYEDINNPDTLFNWSMHFEQFASLKSYQFREVEFVERGDISNDLLKGTPLEAYLRQLRAAFYDLRSRLEADYLLQTHLLDVAAQNLLQNSLDN